MGKWEKQPIDGLVASALDKDDKDDERWAIVTALERRDSSLLGMERARRGRASAIAAHLRERGAGVIAELMPPWRIQLARWRCTLGQGSELVLLHPIPCTKTTVCEQGDLLGPLDADGESHRASSIA